MAKRSSSGMGSLIRKKLSDITNNYSDADIPSLQQLLHERTNLLQLLSHKDEIIESHATELRRLQSDIKKLQLQNLNLAHSNTLMLSELNLGRNRIKTLQHEISCTAALIKENAPKTVITTLGSTVDSKQNASKDKIKDNNRRRSRTRRYSGSLRTQEHEGLENLFEIEDTIMLNPCSVGGGESLKLRNEGPRNSFGRPLRRRAAEKIQSYKEVPLNVKMRRVE
ncbi:hypothetical protein PIB30_055540 [Stylosanthes scabra]|uniref:Shugoshin C-terminal domain-containing protein n=1 Tax=Stylosanthes scabra TaxID=79078 RepID=A0ABU6UIL0_9FABA|nr:hypothetical protein [Stylosanthes scabra]